MGRRQASGAATEWEVADMTAGGRAVGRWAEGQRSGGERTASGLADGWRKGGDDAAQIVQTAIVALVAWVV